MSAQELNNTVLKNSSALKAYYRFSTGDLTTDSSASGLTLTNNNTVTDGTGVYGGAASFASASTQYFSTSGNIGISGNGARSVSLWVKTSTAGRMEYVGWGAGSTNAAFVLGSDSSSEFYVIAYGANDINTTYPMNTGSWIHVAVTHDGTNTRLYFNGQYHSTYARTYNTTDSVLNIGRQIYADAGPQYWYLNGSIDDLAIFSSALSADQIKELYEGRFIGEAWPQSGLVGGWHLNGSSTDFSGNNNHGTDTAITYSQANGKFGQGAGFNGSSSLILLATTALPTGSTARTISVWANFSAQPGTNGQMYMVNWGTASSNALCAFIYSDSSGTKKLNLAGYANDASISYTLSNSVWYHLVVTYSGTTVTFYVNGNNVGTATISAFNTGSTGAMIGRPYWDTSAYLNGKLDEVLIFNRALTASEIRKMYGVGTGKYY